MGFFRNQEIQMAARLLAWRHKKAGLEIPDEKRLTEMAKGVVEEAHRIARQRPTKNG